MATKTFKIGLSATDKTNMAQDIYERLIGMCFDEYDPTKTYNTGDFVVYENPSDTFKLYKCLEDNVTGAWDGTKWELATFQDLVDDVEGAVASVADKANVDGNYPTMAVGYADQAGSLRDTTGDELNCGINDEPFSVRPTAFPFDETVISVGNKVTVNETRAYAFVKNNFVNVEDGTTTRPNGLTITRSGGKITITGTPTETDYDNLYAISIVSGHKVMLRTSLGQETGSEQQYVSLEGGLNAYLYGLGIATANGTTTYLRYHYTANVAVNLEFYVQVIDLTQWFNNDATILAGITVPWFLNNFGKFIPSTYNTGAIENTYARKIRTTGVNLWDGVHDIRVVCGRTYYCKGTATLTYKDLDGNTIDTESVTDTTFTVPNNCIYVGVSGTNIQICNHWTETDVEQTYHPFEEWEFGIDWTDIVTPLGINSSIGDYKDYKNGKNGKVVRSVDLSTLSWSYNSSHQHWAAVDNKLQNILTNDGQFIAAKYFPIKVADFGTSADVDGCIIINQGNKQAFVKDSTGTNTPTGTIQVYLDEATRTITDMSESEKLNNAYDCNDYGNEEILDGSDNYTVGAFDLLYQKNLARQIVNNQDAIADLRTDLTSEATARGNQDTVLQNAIGGTLRQCLCVKESLDFENTDVVDLGELTWFSTTNDRFYSSTPSVAPAYSGSTSTPSKILCSKYKTVDLVSSSTTDLVVSLRSDGGITIRDLSMASYTTDQVKAAMKGVLLAYEKASE